MKNIINYTGAIMIKQGATELVFDKCKINIVASEISNKTTNVFNSTIVSKKGYNLSADMTFYIISNADKSLFDGLASVIFNLDSNNKLSLNILNKSNSVIKSFDFDILEEALDYNKFLNNNFNIGNEINIKLSSGFVYSILSTFWIDEAYSNILTINTYLEDLVL